MTSQLQTTIQGLDINSIPKERLAVLQPLIDYLHPKVVAGVNINLNLICTHNSRRSHLSQIWAQTMADVFGINNVYCYSGGTEATAVFQKLLRHLFLKGF